MVELWICVTESSSFEKRRRSLVGRKKSHVEYSNNIVVACGVDRVEDRGSKSKLKTAGARRSGSRAQTLRSLLHDLRRTARMVR